MNEVNARRTRLQLGWVTVFGRVYHLGLFTENVGHCRGGSRGVTRVTSHPLAWQPISCYYYACELSYFDVVLCPSSSQIPQCSLASLARVAKVTPSKNPRSANKLPSPRIGLSMSTSGRLYTEPRRAPTSNFVDELRRISTASISNRQLTSHAAVEFTQP